MHIYTIKKLLNIPEYKVAKIDITNNKELHIWLEPYKRKKALCSFCGKEHSSGFHSYKETTLEDLPISQYRVYLHVKKRRYRCPFDGSIHTEKITWARKWSRVTTRFAEHVSRLTAITTNKEAGWFMGLDDEMVYRIDKEILRKQYEEKLQPPPPAANISVDEVSYRKYHRYLTNVVDVDKRAVIWNGKGRRAEVLDKYYGEIGKDNCLKIETVALDGARTYISSTGRHAINALIVYDKFHVIQRLNRALDTVRKLELRKARQDDNNELIELINCKQRFILLKARNKLTERQAEHLEKLCKINEPIYKAMLLKESFLGIYDCQSPEEAGEYLRIWLKDTVSSGIEVFDALAESFGDKMEYIINWFRKKISSAISEGINNKIKRLKRMAYGYKDMKYFMLKIHQHCGLLNPRVAT